MSITLILEVFELIIKESKRSALVVSSSLLYNKTMLLGKSMEDANTFCLIIDLINDTHHLCTRIRTELMG